MITVKSILERKLRKKRGIMMDEVLVKEAPQSTERAENTHWLQHFCKVLPEGNQRTLIPQFAATLLFKLLISIQIYITALVLPGPNGLADFGFL